MYLFFKSKGTDLKNILHVNKPKIKTVLSNIQKLISKHVLTNNQTLILFDRKVNLKNNIAQLEKVSTCLRIYTRK